MVAPGGTALGCSWTHHHHHQATLTCHPRQQCQRSNPQPPQAFGRGQQVPKRIYSIDELRLNKLEPEKLLSPTGVLKSVCGAWSARTGVGGSAAQQQRRAGLRASGVCWRGACSNQRVLLAPHHRTCLMTCRCEPQHCAQHRAGGSSSRAGGSRLLCRWVQHRSGAARAAGAVCGVGLPGALRPPFVCALH